MILIKVFILGGLSALLFPPYFMTPLGFIIFPYLIKLLIQASNKKNLINFFLIGFFYGLGFLLVFLSWIKNPFFVNSVTSNFAILSILLPIFLSLIFAIGFVFFRFFNKSFYVIIFTPFIFLLIEIIISNIFSGFPWVTFSLMLSNNFFGFYLIKFFGTYASSYLILFFFVIPVLFIYSAKYKYKKKFIFIVHIPFFIVLILLFIVNFNYKDKSKKVTIEIFQILKPLNNINKELVEKDILYKINNSESEYIVFAENNYPYLFSNNSSISFIDNIKDNQKVIIGASRVDNNKFYNSFLFFEKNNIQIFDKKILVPFGEFLPFRKYLKFMENITGNVDFTPGISKRLIKSININILPIICYEIIFDKILKNINKHRIDILINITNDSWFGEKVGPYQHFYHSRVRALISNKHLVRVSNNGISAVIDNNGKIIKSSKLNKKTSFKTTLLINNSIYFGIFHTVLYFYLILMVLFYLIYINYYLRYEE